MTCTLDLVVVDNLNLILDSLYQDVTALCFNLVLLLDIYCSAHIYLWKEATIVLPSPYPFGKTNYTSLILTCKRFSVPWQFYWLLLCILSGLNTFPQACVGLDISIRTVSIFLEYPSISSVTSMSSSSRWILIILSQLEGCLSRAFSSISVMLQCLSFMLYFLLQALSVSVFFFTDNLTYFFLLFPLFFFSLVIASSVVSLSK